MTCKGICTRYKAQKPVGTGRYASGQRRCQICEIFIKWEGLWCPCCGYRLRTKPRNLKYKAKLRARVEADSHPERITIEVTQPKIKSIVAKKMVSQTIKVPRKVGRPRKTVEQVVADEPIAVKVPRKVGRPRKTVEPVLVEEAIAINA